MLIPRILKECRLFVFLNRKGLLLFPFVLSLDILIGNTSKTAFKLGIFFDISLSSKGYL